MGIVRKVKNSARWIENIAKFEAPRPEDADESEPPADQQATADQSSEAQ
ncbi:hypothetical protein [Amycolatopsis sp. NPDC051128]